MGDLSEHFDRKEFECHHCGNAVIVPKLIPALEKLRILAGRPIRVTSGYRCPEHNKAIGGAASSQHCLGTAADIAIGGLSIEQMYVLASQVEEFSQGGIAMYDDGHLHVDVRPWRARWAKLNGKEVSIQAFFAHNSPTGNAGVSS